MDTRTKERTVQRALGLALMRQALDYLDKAGEVEASARLQLAIDAVPKGKIAAPDMTGE